MDQSSKKEWIISGGFLLLAWGIILATYQAIGDTSYVVYLSGIITLIGASLLGKGFVMK